MVCPWSAATAALMQVDSSRLVLDQQTYSEIRDAYFHGDRTMVWLLGAVCVALLVVTALGIVGLASFWVQQRTKQIGIRRALGATRGQILRYFQTENFLLASIGIVLGMVLAYAVNQLLMGRYELPRLKGMLSQQKSGESVQQSKGLAVARQDRTLLAWLEHQALPERADRLARLQQDAEELVSARVGVPVLEGPQLLE